MHLDLSEDTGTWQQSLSSARSPAWKRLIYLAARPGLSSLAHRQLTGYASELTARWVLPGRGFGLEARRKWLDRRQTIRDSRLLVLGTGTGWDVVSWTAERPAHIIGADLFSFATAWQRISEQYPGVSFIAADSEALPIALGSIDCVASDAFFEHCINLPAVLAAAHAALRPGGWMYASYGPMWFSAGGDHFSGIDGLASAFSHLELSRAEYASYVNKWRHLNTDAQSGPRYIDLDLFSRLRTSDYLALFDAAGFDLVDLVLEISTDAVAFRRRWPQRFAKIASDHDVDHDDLILKTNIVLLQARPSQSPQLAG